MSKAIPTLDELQAEFVRLGGPVTEAEGMTVEQFGVAWGCGENKVRDRLRQAKALGLLKTGLKLIESLNGIQRRVPCYWFDLIPKDVGKAARRKSGKS